MSTPDLIIDGDRWLIMGAPKSGKSTLGNTFPDPLVIDLDGKANKYAYVDSERIICHNLKEAKRALTKIKSCEFQTAILDPLDRIVEWISMDICSKGNKEAIGDFAYNKGRDRLDAQTKIFVNSFWDAVEGNENLKATIIIAHCQSSDDTAFLVVPKHIRSWLTGIVSNIGFTFKRKSGQNNECLLDLNGTNVAEAGCRSPTLNAAGTIPNDYEEIVDLFRPDPKDVTKLLTWLEKEGGIPRKLFLAFCEQDGKDDEIDVYARLRKLRKRPKLLAKYQRRMENHE